MTQELLADLRSRINPAYENVRGTESYERKQCADAIEALQAENERLRVQLAGCGVAAMQNTESSKAQRVQKESYGWSESYGDVCRAVDREIELRAERDQLQAENERLELALEKACRKSEELQSRLDAMGKGEAVGVFRTDENIGHIELMPYQGQPMVDGQAVYAAPKALTDEQISAARLDAIELAIPAESAAFKKGVRFAEEYHEIHAKGGQNEPRD